MAATEEGDIDVFLQTVEKHLNNDVDGELLLLRSALLYEERVLIFAALLSSALATTIEPRPNVICIFCCFFVALSPTH